MENKILEDYLLETKKTLIHFSAFNKLIPTTDDYISVLHNQLRTALSLKVFSKTVYTVLWDCQESVHKNKLRNILMVSKLAWLAERLIYDTREKQYDNIPFILEFLLEIEVAIAGLLKFIENKNGIHHSKGLYNKKKSVIED
ncbi:hypothetical protein [Neobacillus sp. YIM B06451]|uniref:hypothetical protein n=1 Tax=Neobacillus sp. YIM B06451 TaxID=3070994 RepID=UPI002930E1FF|nr:hypothetical protein [Neobacillus sp. YIM B06451]